MNVFMFPCIKVTSSMSYLIKRLFVQIHLRTSQSDTNEEWADSHASFHGNDTNEEWAKIATIVVNVGVRENKD